jgi:hypothetical protein
MAYGSNNPCTLTASAYAKEGFLSVSADGSTLVFGCYAALPNTQTYSGATARVVARVYPNGTTYGGYHINVSCNKPLHLQVSSTQVFY